MVTTGSLITKKVIAYSLKDLSKTSPYSKISIKHIMDHADYRRQTFYDHFTDKQDLLNWIYQQELREVSTHYINYESWEAIIKRLLVHFLKNADFYLETMDYNHVFDREISKQLSDFTLSVLQKECQSASHVLEQQAYWYAHAMTNMIKLWLIEDRSQPDQLTNMTTCLTNQLQQVIKKIA